MTYLEQKRREAQAMYLEEKRYIDSNRENFAKLLKDEQDAMAREMTGTFWSAAQYLLTGQPPEGAKRETPSSAAAGAASADAAVPITIASGSPQPNSQQKPVASV